MRGQSSASTSSACQSFDMPASEEYAYRSRAHRMRVLADALPPAGRTPLRGASQGRPSRVPAAHGPLPGPLHCDRPLMYGGAGRGVDWAGPVGRRGAPLGASTESRRGSSSPPARRRLAPVEGAGWPVAVVLQRLMVHGPCNAQHTLLSHGTSLQRAAASSQSATTLLHTSDSLVGSEMQRRRDCNHLQPSSVTLHLSNTSSQPLWELHRPQAGATNLRILARASAHRMARGPCLGRRPEKGHTPQD